MTEGRILNALGQVADAYILEASPLHDAPRQAPPPRFRRRLPGALVAALLALLLMGAGVAAVIYGDSIQNWFERYWETMTGQAMTEEHAAVIDHLSQEIGVGRTVGDVTVTVDSATVGDDILYLLLRVEGLPLSNRYGYGFDSFDMEVSPDPLEASGGMGAIGIQFQGRDGDGSAIMLMEYEYLSNQGFAEDPSPLEVTLHMKDFVRHGQRGRQKTLAEGEWSFAFTIDRSRLLAPISLPDTEVTAYDSYGETVTATLTHMELTSTGLRFRYDLESAGDIDYGRLVEISPGSTENGGRLLATQVHAVLENGLIVEFAGGSGVPLEGSELWANSLHWRVPVNLDEVAAIQIGETRIPVP